ncbi:MAG: hypothetical protein A3K10_11890 [Bacteroidetes bacterium RIFCSPLOWO2_12_FULL_31_6]|nr:MAG: hypothetical protein A3K10_11890 [Bacteroidetes bacterium RIFCSPLOWO2_12_FULL_31_6]
MTIKLLKNKMIIPILIIIGIVVTTSCEDMIRENMEKKTVSIISPPNNYQSDELSITFYWNEVDGADYYNIRVWDDKNVLKLDENVDTTIYDYSFPYFGTYTWQVKAVNSATESPFTTYTIFIDSTSDLSQTTLNLSSPDDNYYYNDMDVVFEWDALYSADDYRFEITDLNGNLIDNTVITTYDSISYTFAEEGDYIWMVRGQNVTSNTAYSYRYITIDTTIPNTPTLIYPFNTDSISTYPFTMSWNRWGETGSPIADSLHLASDSLFTSITTVLKTISSDSTYSVSDTLTSGNYFWFITSFDAAGNISSNSDTIKFYVK